MKKKSESKLPFADQEGHVIDRFKRLFEIWTPSGVVELGCGKGGFTVKLAPLLKCPFFAMDSRDKRPKNICHDFEELNIRFHLGDLYSQDVTSICLNELCRNSPVLLLNDIHHKKPAADTVAEWLRPGDVFMTHDYRLPGNHGLTESDLVDLSGRFGLMPFHQDIFDKDPPVYWSCSIKGQE